MLFRKRKGGENTFVPAIPLIQLLNDLPVLGNGKDMPCLLVLPVSLVRVQPYEDIITASGIFGTGPHPYSLHPGWIGFPIRFVPLGSDMDANYFG